MTQLNIKNITRDFGDFKLNQINLELTKGKVLALLGESGSGKSTLLRIIAGLESHEAGEVKWGNQTWSNDHKAITVENRGLGFVFQDYALFPHMDVANNIFFGMKTRDKGLLEDLLSLVKLQGYASKKISELSGGEQQRVALARCLATKPQLLLMDEPFSNLDSALKQNLRNQVKTILDATQITTIIVTHDLEDAFDIADEIAILKDGELLQVGSPEELYQQPVNEYVANLTGDYFIWDNAIRRPEDLIKDNTSNLKAEVKEIQYRGAYSKYLLEYEGQRLIANLSNEDAVNVGDYLNFKLTR